jgi:hypothetical protein
MMTAMALVAGCLGGSEEPVTQAAVDEPATSTTSGEAPAAADPTPSAASPAAQSVHAHDEPAAPDAAPPTLVDVPFEHEGTIAAGVCAPAGVNSCMGPNIGLTEDSSWGEVKESRRIVRVALTLTWEAAAPTTEELTFTVLLAKSCGDRCTEGKPAIPSVTGTSPLTIAGELPVPAEGGWYEVLTRQTRATPEPIYGYANPDQPFTVEGTLTVEEP